MIYTKKINDAIRFAIKTHEVYQKQKRKGKDVPYIVHPLTVGLILARAATSEDVIVAGILHDTIEDSTSEKKVTREMLIERFGEAVADLVVSVSEMRKELPWEERKQTAFEHIASFSRESLLVKSADLISNVTECAYDYERNGEAFFADFKVPILTLFKHYARSIDAILERWPESPLADDLADARALLAQVETRGSEQPASTGGTLELYLDAEQQKVRRIAFVHCEDEDDCGFFVEFKHPNCTFFFCKEHKMGFNLDLATVTEAGVECKQHGKMERYDVLSEDNVCPRCEKTTLAILSVGR